MQPFFVLFRTPFFCWEGYLNDSPLDQISPLSSILAWFNTRSFLRGSLWQPKHGWVAVRISTESICCYSIRSGVLILMLIHSRPGALIAGTWAALQYMGYEYVRIITYVCVFFKAYWTFSNFSVDSAIVVTLHLVNRSWVQHKQSHAPFGRRFLSYTSSEIHLPVVWRFLANTHALIS